jgi:hypothetical protein
MNGMIQNGYSKLVKRLFPPAMKRSLVLCAVLFVLTVILLSASVNDISFAKRLFSVLGRGGFGFAPFGIDYSGYINYPLGSAEPAEKAIPPFAEEYKLLAPMVREIARLNFAGRLKTAVEEKSVPMQSLNFENWQVDVSYGVPEFGFGNNPPGNPAADGRVLVAELGPDEFLVTGIDARVVFRPSPSANGKQMEYVHVEEGRYENGNWHFIRIWNGDQTDWGLNFKHVPYVLRVKLDRY